MFDAKLQTIFVHALYRKSTGRARVNPRRNISPELTIQAGDTGQRGGNLMNRPNARAAAAR